MKTERERKIETAMWSSFLGMLVAAVAAAAVYGAAGLFFVVGTYVSVMSGIEYWRSQP